jgi:hypothetical protein
MTVPPNADYGAPLDLDPDALIETCLVCIEAWNISRDPPRCQEATHPHALARIGDWLRSGHGLAV